MTVRVDQAGASLLGPKEAPPPPPANGAGAGGAGEREAPPPPPAFDEAWVRKCIVLLCNGLAEEWGPEMRATELELGILVPVLHAMAMQHAPDFMAGRAPEANLWVLGGIVLYMGARRGMAIRRRRRLGELPAAPPRAPKPTPAAGPATHAAPAAGAPAGAAAPAPARPAEGGAFGRRPLVLGGRLGDGRRL